MALIKDRYELQIDTKGALSGISGIKDALSGLANFRAAGITVVATAVAAVGSAMVQASREMAQLEQRLALVTSGSGDLARTMITLRQSAIDSRASFADFVELFSTLNITTSQLGFSQQEIIKITENLSKALAVAGADAATTSSVIRQFGQAMGSGVVRGDEFNSLVEGLGPALAIMAQESGKSVAELRRMAEEGKLTATVMADMLLESNALNEAFSKMAPTAAQVEQQTTQAFSRLAAATAEWADELLNVSDIYKAIVGGAGDAANEIARVIEEANLANALEAEDIDFTTLDAVLAKYNDISDVLEEVRRRGREAVEDFEDVTIFDSLFGDDENLAFRIAELEEIERILEGMLQREYVARVDAKAVEEALEPYQALIERIDEYTAANEKTLGPLERAREAQRQAAEDIRTLEGLIGTYEGGLFDVNGALEEARLRHEELTEEVLRLGRAAGELTFGEFFQDIINQAQRAVDQTEMYEWALEDLDEAFANGVISPEVYAEAMERVRGVLDRSTESATKAQQALESATRATKDYLTDLNQSTEDAQFELESLNMDPLQRQIAEISRDLNRDLQNQIEDLNRALEDGADPTAIQQQIQQITAATQQAIQNQTDLATRSYEQQRSFSYGWAQAFKEYEENATNAAERAGEIFDKVTSGMEDAIVNFAKTGKFEFRTFLADIVEQILRSQVQRLIAQLFGITGLGGGSGGGLFAGFFANGGTIPAGQFGVVGERGPELVTGPATVTPLGGGQSVNYYINAIDARSFQELLARDPKFIHAIAEKGRQSISGNRR